MFYNTYISSLGTITLASDGSGLTGLWIEGQKYHGAATDTNSSDNNSSLPIFTEAKDWLNAYFAGQRPSISFLQLSPAGSAFRQAVWHALCDIPYGKTTTYKAVTQKLAEISGGGKGAFQAVGGAIAHNPISIIIPCHRVVGSDGSLTGYAGGIHTKVKLLKLEGADMSRLFVPNKGSAL